MSCSLFFFVNCFALMDTGSYSMFYIDRLLCSSTYALMFQVSCLVMCHTRELAFQISKEYERFSKFLSGVKVRISKPREEFFSNS